ncbi:fimbrial protein [Citrobacter koseri]|uniref:fimbrial protein n=1 Tax=Citrobacter koseri TaxID=545 RepID=UPI000668CDEF|nr:fimbrial protein [Citrobacter koseri]HEM6801136.1 type 1 fimbrial protein [Citrobacter koseri]
MQIQIRLYVLLAASVMFQASADIPRLPQYYTSEHSSEDSAVVRFHGSVLASPCELVALNNIQVVDMGNISASSFHQAGDRSRPVMIKFHLRDCLKGASGVQASVSTGTRSNRRHTQPGGARPVQLTFVGESDLGNSQLLRTTGSMKGAGVRFLDIQGKALDINQVSSPYLVGYGDSELTFMAMLESTGRNVSAGEFRGLVRLKMEYL